MQSCSHFTNLFRDDIEGRYEEFVTNQGQGVEHVNDSDYVEDNCTMSLLFEREQVRWEKVPGRVCKPVEKYLVGT